MQQKTAMGDPMAAPGTFSDDDPDGTVWAIAVVTGIRDDVGDVIEPGAFGRSLRVRTPKGMLGHDWSCMVARADQVIELMPGDARLPTTLADGTTWPAETGALLVRGRFNLSTSGSPRKRTGRITGPAGTGRAGGDDRRRDDGERAGRGRTGEA